MTAPAKVLVIEDNPVYLKLIELYLRNNAFEYHACSDAESAESWVGNNQFDWVISDYNLPGQNGYQLLQKLQHRKRNNSRFIMITANKNVKNECCDIDNVVDRLLYKPITNRSLEKILKEN
jgi:DNA-binding response OmpR family regulator